MEGLRIALNATTNCIKLRNIKLDDTEKKIVTEERSQEFVLQHHRNLKQNLSVKINLEEDADTIQQKRRPKPFHLPDQVAGKIKRTIKNGSMERATKTTEDCFVSPAVITVKTNQ